MWVEREREREREREGRTLVDLVLIVLTIIKCLLLKIICNMKVTTNSA